MTQCAFCHKEVIPQPETMGVVSPNDPEMIALLKKIGRRCHVCGQVSCQPCAFKASKQRGNRYFTCPKCGANIHENRLDTPQEKKLSWWQKLFGAQEKPDAQPDGAPAPPIQPKQKKSGAQFDFTPVAPGQPDMILLLVNREPPPGRDTHLRLALQGLAPGYPVARAVLQVNSDYANPYVVGTTAMMLAHQYGFKADLDKLEFRDYQSADGVSGSIVSIFRA